MEQKPTIGRIVHYKAEGGKIHPAIITEVFTSTCVNLEVFGDPSTGKYPCTVIQGDGTGQWQWPART